MTVTTQSEADASRLFVEGSVNSQTAPDFEKAVKAALAVKKNVIVDFAKTDYLSSAGLRVLLFAANAIEAPAKLSVVNVPATIQEVFDMTGFSALLGLE